MIRSITRSLAAFGAIAGAAAGLAANASAAPDKPKDPYPDISRFVKQDFESYRIAGQPGVWFSAPSGLDCGIWEDGSFGCTGEIPDSPSGTNQIGWFTGDSRPHFDNTRQLRFSNPDGDAQRVLPANNYLEPDGSKCGVAPDGGVFCEHGGEYNAFLIAGGKTVIGNDWNK